MKLMIDPATGMAGDMFVAALISAGAGREKVVGAMAKAIALLGKGSVETHEAGRQEWKGLRIVTSYEPEHHHREAALIAQMLAGLLVDLYLQAPYRRFAETAFDILCRAEAHAHENMDEAGRHQHAVHLHEAQDILVDIAGSAFALQELAVDPGAVTCLSPVHYGGGTIEFSHGVFTVPAPATQSIIETQRIPVAPGPVSRELLTPTGAAILAALDPSYAARESRSAQDSSGCGRTGIGYGTAEFEEAGAMPNALRVFLCP